MSEYRAPLQEIRFALNELASLEHIAALPGYEEATPDVVNAVLDEAAKFAGEVLSVRLVHRLWWVVTVRKG